MLYVEQRENKIDMGGGQLLKEMASRNKHVNEMLTE